MIIECKKCGTVHGSNDGLCPKCGEKGGFLQDTREKLINDKLVRVNDVLLHEATKNKYKVKEFQKNGMVAELVHCLGEDTNGNYGYISYSSFKEYK